jgi:hypothetical protein
MEVTNCTDINGVELNEVQFNVDGTVVGILDTLATSNLSYDCCVAQGYTFDPTDTKCYWADTCLTGGTYNIVLDPQGNTGAFFQVDDNQKPYCTLELKFKFLLKVECENLTESLRSLIETLKLEVSVEKVIYDENLPIPNNLEEISRVDLFNVTDIFTFFQDNTNTGILLDGDCDFVTNNLINDLAPNADVLNDFSLDSDWFEFSLIIDDIETLQTIFNERLKISIIGNELKNFGILIDDVQLNRVCDIPTPPAFLDEECPKFELKRIIDNKKSWVENEALITREFDLERRETEYDINHEKLSINTKEIDLALNPSQAIENDIVTTVVGNDCLLAPATGCTSGDTTHSCIDLRPLITTEVVNNNDLINQLIDVKNRKVLNGYPTLDLVYHRYLNSDEHCGLTTNSLTSDSIGLFLELIGTYWSDLIEQIVPATTIWGSSLTNSDSNSIASQGVNKFVYRTGSLFYCTSGPSYPVPSPTSGDESASVLVEDVTDGADDNLTQLCTGVSVRQINSGSEFIGTVIIIGEGEGPTSGDTISITETITDDCNKFETC